MARSERELQRSCLDVYHAYHILAWGVNRERAGFKRASHIGFKGHPDIAGVLPNGRAFFCEVKLPGQRPTIEQTCAMRLLAKQGAFVCLVHAVDEAQDAAQEATRT
jgi:hypothetical protein